jgi:predicted AAA+ superfamily ATPase
MWIERYLEARILESARTRPVVVLTGARQTGKTSTLRRLFPDHAFVSLDLPTEAEQAEREPSAFLRRYRRPPSSTRSSTPLSSSGTSRPWSTRSGAARASTC